MRDEHDILWSAGKYLDVRLFASVTKRNDRLYTPNYDDIYEPLNEILECMKRGGVKDVPCIDVIYNLALVLAGAMRKDILDYYTGCRSQETACQKWHYMTNDGVLHVHSGKVIQRDI